MSYHSLECLEEHGIARNDIQKLNAAGESDRRPNKITLADLQFLSQLVVIVRIFHERVLHDRVGTYKQRNSRRHESL